MGVAGSRVAVVGGSIAGCAAAIALRRAGCRVEVYERSERTLQDRGLGMLLPIPLRDELIAARYLPENFPACRIFRREWVLADGTAAGKLLWEQPVVAAGINWGGLWRSLRDGVPDENYHAGAVLRSFTQIGDRIEVTFNDGTRDEFDVLVGADGYRSVVRPYLDPTSSPRYAGYILWRGTYPESRLTDRASADAMADAMQTVAFDGGHSICYLIPDLGGGARPGTRCVNWAVYTAAPPGLDFARPTSIATGQVSEDLYRHLDNLVRSHFPPDSAALIRRSRREEISVQPIYDEVVEAYARGRVVLIGDAGTITRPHTGGGATKALEDALELERAVGANQDWDGALQAYGAHRVGAGNTIVELGRRIGGAQVSRTPAWAQMTEADFESWISATLAGKSLYWWADQDPAEPR